MTGLEHRTPPQGQGQGRANGVREVHPDLGEFSAATEPRRGPSVDVALRPYQQHGLDLLRESLRRGNRRVMFYLPTGGGKTECAAAIFLAATAKGKSAAFICNRIELVGQASRRFHGVGLDHGILQADNSRGEWKRVLVGSIQTIASRGISEFDLIIVDEAHGCAASAAYHKVFEQFKDVPIIGLSATPFVKGLGKEHAAIGGKLFEDLVVPTTIRGLIDLGFLVDVEIFGPSEPDLSEVKIVAGEYHQGQLEEAVDKGALIGDIVEHWKKLAGNQRTICFATSIEHSKHIVEQFQAEEIPAAHIDAYTPENERRIIIDAFKRGEYLILSNCAVLAEGFDCPAAAVMILARPTRSLARYIQMAGRVLRPAEGKTKALILDHSGTARRLGFPTDDLPLELDDGKPRKQSNSERKEPLPRLCPNCSYLMPPRTPTCPACGRQRSREEMWVIEGELKKLERGAEKSDAKRSNREWTWDQKAVFMGELRQIAFEHGYREGWAANKYRERFDVWPNDPRVREAPRMMVSEATRKWVKSRAIAWAKGNAAHGRQKD